MKPTERNIPVIARILNPVKEYYFQSSYETQANINNLSSVLIFTSVLCGAILAASIVKFVFDGNYLLFIPIFIVCSFFYYRIDKPIIFSNISKNQIAIRWIRISIAVVFGLFNSFLIDYYYFRNDIESARKVELALNENRIRSEYGVKDSVLNLQRTTEYGKIEKLNTFLASKRENLNSEADGTGGTGHRGIDKIWRTKHAMYLSDSVSTAKQIDLCNNELRNIDSLANENSKLLSTKIENLPQQSSNGINKSIELLHKIIFSEGKFTNILMALLILLISMIFELAPLISKSFYPVSEYFTKADSHKKIKDYQTTLDENKLMNIAGNESLLDMRNQEIKLLNDYGLQRFTLSIEYNKSITEQALNEIERLELLKKNTKGSDYYQTIIEPMIEKSLNNLQNAVSIAYQK